MTAAHASYPVTSRQSLLLHCPALVAQPAHTNKTKVVDTVAQPAHTSHTEVADAVDQPAHANNAKTIEATEPSG